MINYEENLMYLPMVSTGSLFVFVVGLFSEAKSSGVKKTKYAIRGKQSRIEHAGL